MQFLYNSQAGKELIWLNGEEVKHLKARRLKEGARLVVKNLCDNYDYLYEIMLFAKNSAKLELVFSSLMQSKENLTTLAWAVVEPSVVEKTLPSLNELGLGKLVLVYADFSQKDVRLDLQRMRRILINSCEQCGRGDLMRVEVLGSSDELLQNYPQTALLDFGAPHIASAQTQMFFVGPEGGFSERERELFCQKVGLNSRYILRSNTAATAVASLLLT